MAMYLLLPMYVTVLVVDMSKIGVKIFPNIMNFSWEPNRSLSFQFPKLYAIQMPALLKSVVNFLKNKGIESVIGT